MGHADGGDRQASHRTRGRGIKLQVRTKHLVELKDGRQSSLRNNEVILDSAENLVLCAFESHN